MFEENRTTLRYSKKHLKTITTGRHTKRDDFFPKKWIRCMTRDIFHELHLSLEQQAIRKELIDLWKVSI